ncbi:MAG: SDR family NAD(P)-dependent oxidoreductase [Candidatus Nanohaloarchaea archaeon]
MRFFITGGGHGIGRNAAEELLDRGHEVVVFDIEEEYLDELPEEVETHEGDVYDRERVAEVLDTEEFDVLVNCAGYQRQGPVEEMDMDKVERHFETNLFGMVNMIQESLPMLRERSGKIVNVSSVAGKESGPFWGLYSASKHGVEAMSDALRMEVERFDVDVVVVEPGGVRTGFNERGRENLENYLETVYGDWCRERLDQPLGGMSPDKAGEKLADIAEKRSGQRYSIGWDGFFITRLAKFVPGRIKDFIAKRF